MDGRGPHEPVQLSAEDAWALLPAVVRAVSGTEWWRAPEAELVHRIQLLQRVENQVTATQVAAIGEGLSRGLPTLAGARNGAAWLRGLVPVTPYVAGQRAALAQQLTTDEMAPTRDVFEAGEMGAAHAAVICRTVTAVAAVPDMDPITRSEAQRVLVEESERLDPQQLGRAAQHLRNRLDPASADRLARDEDAQQAARCATLVQESSGMWSLNATLPVVAGATLANALDSLVVPRPAQDGTPDPRTRGQRTADGITALAELSLAQQVGHAHSLPTRHGAAVRVLVTADLETVLADVARRGGSAGVPPGVIGTGDADGSDISPLTTQTMLCDAETVPVLLDGDGRALDVGESQYRFPVRIRRAIELRDRHCSFPNCQAPAPWCHTHHLVPFGRNGKPGGPTSEANGTLLCGHHHRHVHANGWTGRLVDGHVQWRPPSVGDPPLPPNDVARQFETKLRQLALRWLARNPQLRDTS